MLLFSLIDPFFFFLGLFLGLLYIYLKMPSPQIVYKYPTPHNAGKITYRDQAGVCYKYRTEVVPCPADAGKVEKQPLQQ